MYEKDLMRKKNDSTRRELTPCVGISKLEGQLLKSIFVLIIYI